MNGEILIVEPISETDSMGRVWCKVVIMAVQPKGATETRLSLFVGESASAGRK
jgi:hypothetical protein